MTTEAQLLTSLETAGYTLVGTPTNFGTWGADEYVLKEQLAYLVEGNNLIHRLIRYISKDYGAEAWFYGGFDPTFSPETSPIKDWLDDQVAADVIEGFTIHDLDPENEIAIATFFEVSGGKIKETRYFIDRDALDAFQAREIEIS